MNDVGNVHERTGSAPLGIEVQAMAFALNNPAPLAQTTFYRYRIVNRSTTVIDSAYVALFADTDLGDYNDDRAGTDTTLGLVYTYNADDFDDVYGVPPAVGLALAQGPVGLPNGRDDDGDGETDEAGERLGMTASPCIWKGYPQPETDPRDAQEHYHRMQGRWNNGSLLREGGNGFSDGGEPTPFCFPGDPVMDQFWSETQPFNDNSIPPINPGDRRMALSTGPFGLGPGEVEELAFAIPFAVGTDRLDSVVRLRSLTDGLLAVYRDGLLAPTLVDAPPPSPLPDGLLLSPPFPNPFADAVAVRYYVSRALPVRLAVYDVLGREVAVLVDGVAEPGEHRAAFAGASLPAGVYLVVFEAAGERRAFPVVKRE
jgi:hypothetical protein